MALCCCEGHKLKVSRGENAGAHFFRHQMSSNVQTDTDLVHKGPSLFKCSVETNTEGCQKDQSTELSFRGPLERFAYRVGPQQRVKSAQRIKKADMLKSLFLCVCSDENHLDPGEKYKLRVFGAASLQWLSFDRLVRATFHAGS